MRWIIVSWIVWAGGCASSVSVKEPTCEYQKNPLGIEAAQPRLSWKLISDKRGEGQTAFQIRVASSPDLLAGENPDLWDSGKVTASNSIQVFYGGKPLSSGQEYFWKVRTWDAEGEPSEWSEAANWSMGLTGYDDWKAKWITAPPGMTSLPIFSRSVVTSKPIRQAVMYVCGLGQFELDINGQKVGDSVLDPGWTNYRRTCLYVPYDVTGQLKTGENKIEIMLGNGMYNVTATAGRYTKFKGSFGPLKLIGQLQIDYADGSSDCVVTDSSWKVAGGPITFSSIYGGEDYDARLEKSDADSAAAIETDSPGGRLSTSSAPAIRVEKELDPIAVTQPKPGVFVYDLGQNCALIPNLTVQGPAGAKVKITPGELLSAGLVSQKYSKGTASCTYTLKGQGQENWSPRFWYFGCRYLQVEGTRPPSVAATQASDNVVLLNLTGRFITSSSPAAGTFSCSNDLFNRTATLIRWAIRNNMMSVLTDCPHREKLGWLEQDHLMGASLMYSFQIPGLYSKICGDMNDAQTTDGLVPDIAPEYTVFSGGFRDSPEWGSACVLLPWQMYQWYGDLSVLRDRYEMMKRYVAYLGSRSHDGIADFGLGDWYDIGPKAPGVSQLTPVPLTATAFYYRDITILEQVARLLGKSNDADKDQQLAQEVRDAFNRKFYNAEAHSYATGSQTANAIPLVFGLAPPADASAIVDNIVKDVRSHNNGLTAGDVGYRYLLRALADGGRSDVIFDMNSSSDRPGYGYMLAHGATSLTEAWNARASSSQDHFMLGHLMEWFYSDLAGIQRDPNAIGFSKIVIKPVMVGDLTWAKATYESPYGTIASGWKHENGKITMDVTIPVNTTATVYVPADPATVTESGVPVTNSHGVKLLRSENGVAILVVESGRYSFAADLPKSQ
jgi:alpha-L-rhamnosidase